MVPKFEHMKPWWLCILGRTVGTAFVVVLAVAISAGAVAAGVHTHDGARTVAPSGTADMHADHRDRSTPGEPRDNHLLGHCGSPICWGSPAVEIGATVLERFTKRSVRPPQRSVPTGLTLVGDPPVPRLG